jgi:hypothetical protein
VDQPVEGPVGWVSARTDRVAQGVVGVALLAAFVFRVPWIVPGLALVLAAGALAGPRVNAFHGVYERWIGPRLPGRTAVAGSDDAPIAAATVRAQDALGAVILGAASLAFLVGIGLVGWLLALGEAVIAIVAATTRIHLGDRVRRAR